MLSVMISKSVLNWLTKKSKTARVVGLTVRLSKRRICMIPKFRAYDSGSLSRMYQPDEVMVGDGNIWIIDEDSVCW